MIDLHYWTTPNGHKITVFLEEAGLEYRLHPVDIGKGEQFAPGVPAHLAEQPHPGDRRRRAGRRQRAGVAVRVGRDPALPGREDRPLHPRRPARPRRGAAVAVLAGGRPRPDGRAEPPLRARYAPEKIPYAIDRYRKETARLYGVLDRRLADRAYLAGDDYTIADMATYPWIGAARAAGAGPGRFPEPRPLVPRHRGAPGGAARLRDRQARQPAGPALARRGGGAAAQAARAGGEGWEGRLRTVAGSR